MADFPPNLDDGELWLPSDIFPPDEIIMPSSFDQCFYSSRLSSYTDQDLTQCSAAYALLQSNHTQTVLKPPPNLAPRCFRPVLHNVSTAVLQGGVVNGPSGMGNNLTRLESVYKHPFMNPVQPQVESLNEARTMVFHRQQNRVVGNRVLPFQQRITGIGSGREYRGTGVFIPRSATPIPNHISSRRRESVRNKQENQVYSLGDSMKRFDAKKEVECHYQLPPEMALPQEWTY